MVAARENQPHFTPEAYFEWEAQQLERHELIDGHVYEAGSDRTNHNYSPKDHSLIAGNILLRIKPHLRGGKYKVFNSDIKINILNTSDYVYPDLSITCDSRDRETTLYNTYPCLIVEVLSPSTEAYDRGKKFEKYRRNPNLIDYVLVSSEEVAVEIYHKNSAGDWVILSYRSGDQVELQSIGLTVAIEEFYEGIIFEK
ncbi:Uma2 family endonuclease [Limnothrix sp. FACHB-881]|uniref:Uma2 family endonuclease n=1 Tax=Limnothrix sp. FACHB-881 TaxID=2692819 RepID=UPI0016840E8C|nr:Uma2 family endonuclease [Limnothrix sp. FACHB-881]MBD2634484.1 Uma2 family endonuclease [Limnothrix sp. FACHB-881]